MMSLHELWEIKLDISSRSTWRLIFGNLFICQLSKINMTNDNGDKDDIINIYIDLSSFRNSLLPNISCLRLWSLSEIKPAMIQNTKRGP